MTKSLHVFRLIGSRYENLYFIFLEGDWCHIIKTALKDIIIMWLGEKMYFLCIFVYLKSNYVYSWEGGSWRLIEKKILKSLFIGRSPLQQISNKKRNKKVNSRLSKSKLVCSDWKFCAETCVTNYIKTCETGKHC